MGKAGRYITPTTYVASQVGIYEPVDKVWITRIPQVTAARHSAVARLVAATVTDRVVWSLNLVKTISTGILKI